MLRKYNKKSDVSYSIGVFPTIELLKNRGGDTLKVVLDPKGNRNRGVEEIKSLCKKLNVRVEDSKKSVEFLSKSGNTYAIGVFRKYNSVLKQNSNHLVLDNPSDMGNLGTICRTMLAFGFRDLAIIKPGVDIFDPKVIRASMGAVYKINFRYFESFNEYKEGFKRNYYPFMLSGDVLLSKSVFKIPYSLIFGNEGSGLDDSFKSIGNSVKIFQTEDVDSLNLAISVGIGLHRASLQSVPVIDAKIKNA